MFESTDAERLQWLIDFSNAPMFPGSLSQVDIDRFSDEISEFVFSGRGERHGIGFEGPMLTQAGIEALRYKVRYGLARVAHLSHLEKGFAGWEVSEGGELALIERFVRKGALSLRGPRDAMVLMLASELIASPVGERIAVCAAPDCDTVFYKEHRGALYCSPACAQRTRTRRYKSKAKKKRRGTRTKGVK